MHSVKNFWYCFCHSDTHDFLKSMTQGFWDICSRSCLPQNVSCESSQLPSLFLFYSLCLGVSGLRSSAVQKMSWAPCLQSGAPYTLPKQVYQFFPLGGASGKEPACQCRRGDVGSIPSWGRSPGEGNDNWLQYSCLESPMDRGVWEATVHRVPNSWTRLKWLNMHACMPTYSDFSRLWQVISLFKFLLRYHYWYFSNISWWWTQFYGLIIFFSD